MSNFSHGHQLSSQISKLNQCRLIVEYLFLSNTEYLAWESIECQYHYVITLKHIGNYKILTLENFLPLI